MPIVRSLYPERHVRIAVVRIRHRSGLDSGLLLVSVE